MNRAIQQRRQQQRRQQEESGGQQRRKRRRIGGNRQALMPAYHKCQKTWVDYLLDTLSLVQESVHSLTSPGVGGYTEGMTRNWLMGAKWLLESLTPKEELGPPPPNRMYGMPQGNAKARQGGQLGNVNIWRNDFEFIDNPRQAANAAAQQKNFESSVYR